MKSITGTIIALILAFMMAACSGGGGSSSGSGSMDGSTTVETQNNSDTAPDTSLDALMNEYNGEVVNAVTATGIVNDTAYQFNGYDQYLMLEDNEKLRLVNKGSLEVWINIFEYDPYGGIIHKGIKKDFSDESYSLQFWGDGILIIGLHNDAGTFLKLQSSFKLEKDTWYHVVATWDADKVKLYINGALDNSTDNTIGALRDSTAPVIIGAQISEFYNSSYGNIGVDGILDGVRILENVLSEEEISERYNQKNQK